MKQMMRLVLGIILMSTYVWADDNKVSTGDDKTDAALVDIQDKRRDATGCRARLKTVYKVMDQEVEDTADVFFKKPGLIFVGVSKAGKWVPSMVSDRGMLWTYDDVEKLVTKFNRGRVYRETQLEVDAYVPDPLRPFRGMVWESIRLIQDPDKEMHVFEARLKPNLLSAQLPDALVKVRMRISKKDGLLRVLQAFDAEGNEVVVRQFENVRVDAKIADKMFEFVIPAGAHVMDGTEDAVQILKTLSAAE